MTYVGFESPGAGVPAAVEVRAADFSLVGRCVSGGVPLRLDPGPYHALATLPDGRRVHTTFDVPQERRVDIELPAPDAAAEPPVPAYSRFDLLGGLGDDVVSAWHGDAVRGLVPAEPLRPEFHGGTAEVEPDDRPRVLQFRAGIERVNVVVPAGVPLSLRKRDTGTTILQPRVRDPALACLLTALAERQLERVAALAAAWSSARIETSGDALMWPYVLLAVDDRSATRAITNHHAPLIPPADLAVVVAELAARSGHHELAAQALTNAAELGLPAAAAGVQYAVQRSRLYVVADDFEHPEAIALLLRRLAPFASHASPVSPLTAYDGRDPAQPGSGFKLDLQALAREMHTKKRRPLDEEGQEKGGQQWQQPAE